jgi:hypothetical protein
MRGKPRKHFALIVCTQMEETIPCQDALEASVEVELTHVHHMPLGIRKAFTADLDHGRRCIDADDTKPTIDQVPSDRFAHPAANVENGSSGKHMEQKSIQPRALLKRSAPVAIVLDGMTLV